MNLDFGRIMTAMITPFDKNLEVDPAAVKELVKHLEKTGTNTIVLAGTTGEGPTVTEEEKMVLLNTVYEQKSPDTKIIMNVGTNNTKETVEKAIKWSNNEKVDGIMVVCPYYNKPSQNGIFKHFEVVNECVNKPIMAYHIPGRTNVSMTAETMIRVARLSNVVALKDAEGNMDKLKVVIQETKGNWDVYSGDDLTLLNYLENGSKGIVSVASHIIGDAIRLLIDAFDKEAIENAKEIQHFVKIVSDQLFPSFSSNPVPIKLALHQKGLGNPSVRLPLIELEGDEKDKIVLELKKLNVI